MSLHFLHMRFVLSIHRCSEHSLFAYAICSKILTYVGLNLIYTFHTWIDVLFRFERKCNGHYGMIADASCEFWSAPRKAKLHLPEKERNNRLE